MKRKLSHATKIPALIKERRGYKTKMDFQPGSMSEQMRELYPQLWELARHPGNDALVEARMGVAKLLLGLLGAGGRRVDGGTFLALVSMDFHTQLREMALQGERAAIQGIAGIHPEIRSAIAARAFADPTLNCIEEFI